MKGQQRPQRVGLDASSKVRDLPEVLDQGANLLGRVSRPGPRFGFHHGQFRLEVFGLQTAAGVAAKFAYKQPLRLVMPNIIIAPVSSRAVGLSQFFPTVSGIDRAAKLVGIDKGLDDGHRMSRAGLPIAA